MFSLILRFTINPARKSFCSGMINHVNHINMRYVPKNGKSGVSLASMPGKIKTQMQPTKHFINSISNCL